MKRSNLKAQGSWKTDGLKLDGRSGHSYTCLWRKVDGWRSTYEDEGQLYTPDGMRHCFFTILSITISSGLVRIQQFLVPMEIRRPS